MFNFYGLERDVIKAFTVILLAFALLTVISSPTAVPSDAKTPHRLPAVQQRLLDELQTHTNILADIRDALRRCIPVPINAPDDARAVTDST